MRFVKALVCKRTQPPTTTRRYYARDQKTLTANSRRRHLQYLARPANLSCDWERRRNPKFAIVSKHPHYWRSDPKTRELEAVGWVSSNYVTGFTYRWDGFRAPVAGRYRINFSAYTLWAAPGGMSRSFANSADKVGKPRHPQKNTPDYDEISPGRTNEPITVYTREGTMNRRVGGFDLTPEPAVYDIGEVWLLSGETLVPDASRFYRSRPPSFQNPLMTKDGMPSVAFRWMEVEGPLYDDASTAGYRLLFEDLPLREVKNGTRGVAIYNARF